MYHITMHIICTNVYLLVDPNFTYEGSVLRQKLPNITLPDYKNYAMQHEVVLGVEGFFSIKIVFMQLSHSPAITLELLV